MKISRRMARILVLMLNSPEHIHIHHSSGNVAAKMLGLKPRASLASVYPRYEVSQSQMNSFNRTLNTMIKLKLITYERIYGVHSLTEKGRKLAAKIDIEVKKFVEDFSPLPQIAHDIERDRREEEEFHQWLEKYEREVGPFDQKDEGRTLWEIFKKKHVESEK